MEVKNKKILFFSRDPGAANCVIPVYERITNKYRIDADLLGKDFALNKYTEANLKYEDINKLIYPIDIDSVKKFLKDNKYTLVVTGVESTDFTNILLWRAANELGIKSIAIIDGWINYASRFTFDELGEYKENSPKFFPTFICTIDEYAKKEMLSEGLPEEKIIITGQPYFETVKEHIASIDEKKQIETRTRLFLKESEHVITFVSEPITESYSDPFYFGYTEFTILEQVIEALKDTVLDSSHNYILVIRLHPRNNKELFGRFVKNINFPKNLRTIIEDKLSSQELVAISDIVVGMSSMFLVETAIAGKLYSSVQIGLKTKDPFVLSRLGISKTILSYDDLVILFQNYIKKGIAVNSPKFSVIPNASSQIVELIEKIL